MLEHQIRERAYFIWIAKGCPQGEDEQNWIAAEHELRAAGECAMAGKPAAAAEPAKRKSATPKAKMPKTRAKGQYKAAAGAAAEAL